MDKLNLYDSLADRKFKEKDLEPYYGGNGRVDKCLELYKKNVLKSGEIHLDVGGGIGDLGFALRDNKLFKVTYVLDISQTNLRAAQVKGNLVAKADVDQSGLPFLQETLCSITALDFIEHIIDPENFARECYRILKKGGEVFINTPNIQYFEHLSSLVMNQEFPHTSGDREVYHGGHLAFYTFNDMQRIFSNAGFKKCEQVMDSYYKHPGQFWINCIKPKNHEEYEKTCLRLGCPNLLFKCEK